MQKSISRKPEWLRKKITPSLNQELELMFANTQVNTVCQEAMCPNISECFSKKQATFLILGSVCTRACSFCAVSKGSPSSVDINEPINVAKTIQQLGLKHVVITSPTRDDLDDGGAGHYVKTVEVIKGINESTTVELLIPDMREDVDALKKIANSGAEIIGHNLESIERLYRIRKGADYKRSLRVLQTLSSLNQDIKTKSAIMLGLGETHNEVLSLMQDLLDVGCKYLSIGQYLSPSKNHESVVEYVKPDEFERLRVEAIKMGFAYVKSSPYTRSSYMASEYLECR